MLKPRLLYPRFQREEQLKGEMSRYRIGYLICMPHFGIHAMSELRGSLVARSEKLPVGVEFVTCHKVYAYC